MKPALHPRLHAPMAIAPGWRSAFATAWERWTAGSRARVTDRPRASAEDAIAGTGGLLRVVDGVGVIRVDGPLTNATSDWAEFICEIFGGTMYRDIWRALEAADRTTAVRAILMRFDTPGGDADGVGELARYIASVGGRKTMWSHVGAQCCSAGIWLSSQTSRIEAVAEATLGSIGVRCTLYDYAKLLDDVGVREIELVADVGPKKRYKPIDDEVVARVQQNIDDLGELFVAAVAAGREVTADKVLTDFGQGDVMLAAKAVGVGLIDGVNDFNATLAALQGAVGASVGSGFGARASDGRAITGINFAPRRRVNQ